MSSALTPRLSVEAGVLPVPSAGAPHIAARSLSFSRGPTQIVCDVDLVVSGGDRIGVIGPNGVGKSTLLRLLAGELEPTAGSVSRHPTGVAVGLLHQELRPDEDLTVGAHLAERTGVRRAEAELARTADALASGAPGADDGYAAALDAWIAAGVADFDARLERTLDRVGLGAERIGQTVATLSGGETARVDLAAILLHQAPILLLDEPTNDLDTAGLALLEEALLTGDRGLVIVSHDRAVLERTATTIVELDGHTRRATTYAGGWEAYERERDAARQRADGAHQENVAARDRLTARLHRQQEWARDGVRRAVTRPRDNDKNIRAGAIERAQKTGGQRARLRAELARLPVAAKPWEDWTLHLDLAEAGRSGDLVAGLAGAVVERGSFRLGPVDVELRFGDRVRIVGPNGSGKSTLVDAILGRIGLAAGRRRMGPAVVVGELSQSRDDFAGASLLDAVIDAGGRPGQEARSSLAKLGLSADDVDRPPDGLSPGERTRAVLAVFQLRGVNLLVLDEPTNHLDLPAIEQLETALAGYAGTLLVVSHDRRFVDAVETTRTWRIGGGMVEEA